jgi:UDP-N-acetylmuramoyl-tripeptide--D-alanyl-D-alanine ligase
MKIEMNDILSLKNITLRNLVDIDRFTGISTDSRTIKKGEVFFAIKGDNFDGHNFVDIAISKGAALIVIDKKWYSKNESKYSSAPFLVTGNTIKTLGELANIFRRKFNKPVIALTGSNGKTTTKEMIYSILSKKYNVLRTHGNLNNQIGVPQMIFDLDEKYDIAVIELGTNHFGEIEYLCKILEPDFGLITNIGKGHLQFFKDLNGVRKAKEELFTYLAKHNKFGLINGDDQNVVKASKALTNKRFYGFSNDFDYSGKYIGTDKNLNNQFEVQYNKNHKLQLKLKVLGRHNLMNALAAVAVGLEFKVNQKDIKDALLEFQPVNKRMEFTKAGDIIILNDCYNANPDSIKAALDTLKDIPSKKKKILVLGDMLEVGKNKKLEHESIAKQIKNSGFEYTFLYGPLSRYTYKILADKITYCKHYKDKEELAKDLSRVAESGDIILIKGSRGMKMETVIDKLLIK